MRVATVGGSAQSRHKSADDRKIRPQPFVKINYRLEGSAGSFPLSLQSQRESLHP